MAIAAFGTRAADPWDLPFVLRAGRQKRPDYAGGGTSRRSRNAEPVSALAHRAVSPFALGKEIPTGAGDRAGDPDHVSGSLARRSGQVSWPWDEGLRVNGACSLHCGV